MIILGSPFAFGFPRMIDAISSLGITSGLKLCLDAGDENSYTSGQKWLDVSGGGYDFYRGAGSSSEGSDPTFNGVVGGRSSSEYWSCDGGDYFTYDSANEVWMESLHKNNAAWAFACWLYLSAVPSSGDAAVMFGNSNVALGGWGVAALVQDDGTIRLAVSNGSGSAYALNVTTSVTVNTPGWNFIAGQVDEAAGTGFLEVSATQEDKTTTYSSPSSSEGSLPFEVCRDGGSATFGAVPSGTRIKGLSMWQGTMPSKAQMLELYNATKGIFGL